MGRDWHACHRKMHPGPEPLNCIACESTMDSSSTLGGHVRAILGDEDLSWFDQYAGFPNCMISRVVPRPEPGPLTMVAALLLGIDHTEACSPRPVRGFGRRSGIAADLIRNCLQLRRRPSVFCRLQPSFWEVSENWWQTIGNSVNYGSCTGLWCVFFRGIGF